MKSHLTVLLAAILLPSFANAQTHELRRDRGEIQRANRDLERAKRQGKPRQVVRARDNVRDAKREYRADWRDYRARDRALYARGNWRAPFRYERFGTGSRLRPAYYDRRYYVSDYRRYHLPVPPANARWVRHYDDVILVNLRSGRVLNVIHSFFW